MTAPRAFLIPTDWGQRPLGRLELVEDGPFRIAGAASPMTVQRELVSGTPFVSAGTVDLERDYIGWRTGYTNIAGFYWPGGTATLIARNAKLVTAGNLTNYQFCGTFLNDMGVRIASTNFWMDNSTTGSFGVVGGAVCPTAQFDPRLQPYFVAKSLQSTRADMACYNSNGRLLKMFSRTGISGQSATAQTVANNYFGGISPSQSRNGALNEMVVLVGGLQPEELHAVVSQFYGLFFRPVIERTFFVPAPAAGGVTESVSLSAAASAAESLGGVASAVAARADAAASAGAQSGVASAAASRSDVASAGSAIAAVAVSNGALLSGATSASVHGAIATAVSALLAGVTTGQGWAATATAYGTVSGAAGASESVSSDGQQLVAVALASGTIAGATFAAAAQAVAAQLGSVSVGGVASAVAVAAASLAASGNLSASFTAVVNAAGGTTTSLLFDVRVYPALAGGAVRVAPVLEAEVELKPALEWPVQIIPGTLQ